MRPLAAALAVAGLLTAGTSTVSARQVAEQEASPAALPATRLAQADDPDPSAGRRVRQVAPDLVAPPPVAQGELERVGPRSEQAAPAAGGTESQATADESAREEVLLHRPRVASAGMFAARGGYRVTLAGIEPTPVATSCESSGVSWPCGIHARTAFRGWVRGRAISCFVPGAPADEIVTAECQLGGHDPAAWLVEQGWARALPGGPYVDLEAAARQEGRGIFGPAPSTTLPDIQLRPAEEE